MSTKEETAETVARALIAGWKAHCNAPEMAELRDYADCGGREPHYELSDLGEKALIAAIADAIRAAVAAVLDELRSELERGRFDDLGDVYNWLEHAIRQRGREGK